MSHPSGWLVCVKPIDVAVTRLAARRYSLAHRHQLLDLGMTPRQIHARLASGWFTPVHQGVYLLGNGQSSPEQAVLAACLATGSQAVAAHLSAGALWNLRGVEASAPEITLWADRHRPLHGVRAHRTRVLDPVDVSRRLAIPVTTPARTLRLLAHGWRVLRFTWFDLTERARYVVDSVEGQLVLACPA